MPDFFKALQAEVRLLWQALERLETRLKKLEDAVYLDKPKSRLRITTRRDKLEE